MPDEEENPVVTGLVALVAVAVVIGLLAGIAVLLGSRMLGLSGDTDLASDEPAAGATMYLPDPVATSRAPDPAITLLPTDTASRPPRETATRPSPTETETESTDAQLNLNASPLQASAGDYIMLSGTYFNGASSVLDVWRRIDDGEWQEFNADVSVSGGIFQAQVQPLQAGVTQWKVVDPANRLESDPVTVRIE